MPANPYVLPEIAEARGLKARLARRFTWMHDLVGQGLARRGVPPRLLAFRYRQHVPAAKAASQVNEVHGGMVHRAPLPAGFRDRDALPGDPGWWGFAFRDVPARAAGPTRILSIPDARVIALRGGPAGDFTPAVLDASGRSLDLREIRHRPFHAGLDRHAADLEMDEATWVAERVFDNYSHWFTAHLPKLVMLQSQGALTNLVLPAGRPGWMDESLARIGVGPGDFAELPVPGVLSAKRLRIVENDRFRPELLCAAREAVAQTAATRDVRVFVSRKHARGRKLSNEAELESMIAAAGFTPVEMETLSLGEQITLMARCEAILAPHGAGLTNMLFCAAGTRIVEIADPAYPNPNFYAMAAALGHDYRYVQASGVGTGHPLRQDLEVDPEVLRLALEALE